MLLEIQGADNGVKIDGESTLKGFEKFIEVMSYSHGVSNPIQSTTSNTGRTTGRPNFQELSVSKNLDATTPLLNYYCALAKNLGTTRLHLVRQDATADGKDANAIDYMVYEMTDTMISSVSVGGGGGIPTETFSLNFSKLTWTYKRQKPDTGVPGQVVQFWDQATNTGGGKGAS
jgi:type VI secretion system secreted protein Hcp